MKIKFILATCLLLFTASCSGSGSGSTVPAAQVNTIIGNGVKNTANNLPAVATTKTITITLQDANTSQAVVGAVVQLDQNGATTTSDGNGIASFLNTSIGAHDIHIFANGYEWDSVYQTISSNLQWGLIRKTISYVNFTGTVQQLGLGSSLELFLADFSINETYTGKCTVSFSGNYTCSIPLDNIVVGKSGNFDLWAIERDANNTVIDAVQLQSLNNFFVTSTANANASLITQAIMMNPFNNAIPILAVNSVIPPTGLPAPIITAVTPTLGGLTLGFASVSPTVIKAFAPFVSKTIWSWAGVLDINGNLLWAQMQKSSLGSTIQQMVAKITSLPVMGTQNLFGQVNGIINFQPATGLFKAYFVNINDINNKTLWTFTLPATVSQFVLPTLPANVNSILATGSNYTVEVSAMYIDNLNYEQGISAIGIDPNKNNFNVIEIGSTGPQSFIR